MVKTNTVYKNSIPSEHYLIRCSKRKLAGLVIELSVHDLIRQQDSDRQTAQIDELRTLITAQQAQIAALQKNSTNSSKPPSSDLPGSGSTSSPSNHSRNSRQSSSRKSGGQPGHKGSTRQLVDNPDSVIVSAPTTCSSCGKDFPVTGNGAISASDEITTRSQVIDIPPIAPSVTEYQVMARTCTCGYTTKGHLPTEVEQNGTIQIGSNASSLLVYLNSAHHLPYQRLQQVARDLFNLPLSQGSIANKLEQVAIAATPLQQVILDSLHRSSIVGSDETGVKVAGARIWQWVWQNTQASYYVISKHRDYQTAKDSFGEDYMGCLIHDCYSAQNNTKAGWHQLCHAHLLRDLQFVLETEHSSWAYQLQTFLIRSQRARDHIWKADFDKNRREQIIDYYYQQLEQFTNQKVIGKEAIRLQKRFKRHQEKILYFMTTADIPPDNNGSERAIRNAKVKQKVSGGYRSHRGAERQALLLSVIETAKKQGLNVLEIIQQLVRGETVQLFGG